MNLFFNSDKSVFLLDPSLEGLIWKFTDGTKAKRVPLVPEVIAPAYSGSGSNPEIFLDKLSFGDGYEQVTEVGIRSVKDRLNLAFVKKRREVALALTRFFRGEDEKSIYNRRPSEYFWFKPPYPFDKEDARPRKFRCEEWKVTPVAFNAYTVTCVFVESFEP